jgi:Ion transport protein
MNIQPRVVIDENISANRAFVYKMVTSKAFEVFILICILLNTTTLAITWYSQPVFVDDILDYINYSFALIFTFEAILKLFALGFRAYFRDSGNAFDFAIVTTSIISTSISICIKADFGASTTFIRAMRMSRVFKYIK